MNKLWVWFFPGYLLALPGTLVGLLLIAWYGVESIHLSSGCIEVVTKRQLIGGPWVGAQTFGNLIFYRDFRMRSLDRLQVHERVHVWQSMVITWPVFIVSYGAHWLVNYIVMPGDWIDAYRAIWAERMAYGREDRANVWGSDSSLSLSRMHVDNQSN